MPCAGRARRKGQHQADARPQTRPPFSAFLYRYRNLVEGLFSKFKHSRAVATRFEKHSENYLALVKLASAKVWMRFTSR
jgi:transposase